MHTGINQSHVGMVCGNLVHHWPLCMQASLVMGNCLLEGFSYCRSSAQPTLTTCLSLALHCMPVSLHNCT